MSDGSRLSQDKKKGEKIIASNAIPSWRIRLLPQSCCSKRTAKKVSNQVHKLTEWSKYYEIKVLRFFKNARGLLWRSGNQLLTFEFPVYLLKWHAAEKNQATSQKDVG